MAEHLLARRGRLWAWTTQDFPPPSPPYAGPTGKDFVPFGVGYVELPGEVKVETRLTEADPDGAARRAWRWSWCWCRSAPTTTATRS